MPRTNQSYGTESASTPFAVLEHHVEHHVIVPRTPDRVPYISYRCHAAGTKRVQK